MQTGDVVNSGRHHASSCVRDYFYFPQCNDLLNIEVNAKGQRFL